ncbi:conserved hypothetical protein [Thiomonas sp. X19]|nr:conserved hypothetical protein [Thiomonas sp. X19]
MAVARIARGHDAVEQVDARAHPVHQIFRRTHAHEVARLVRGQARRGVAQQAQHVVFRLAHAQAADGVAGQVERGQAFQRGLAQRLEHAALHDAEQRVGILQPRELGLAARRPAQREFHRRARLGLGGDMRLPGALDVVRRAFVELHDDVGMEHGLDLHAHFRREKELVAIRRRGEAHALLADFAHRPQAPHLEAAAVGEDGRVPADEAVQPAELPDHVQPRPQPQVEGVAENDLRARGLQPVGRDALDRAIRAHGHELRGVDDPMVEREGAAARLACGVMDGELQHGRIVSDGANLDDGARSLVQVRRLGGCAQMMRFGPSIFKRRSGVRWEAFVQRFGERGLGVVRWNGDAHQNVCCMRGLHDHVATLPTLLGCCA